jgi:tRNA pseudouridine-54 N-methylase
MSELERVFVVPFHRVPNRNSGFHLNSLIDRRVDVLCRAVSSMAFVSCGTRNKSSLLALLDGDSSTPPLSLSFCGLHCRALKPDERSIASILHKVIPSEKDPVENPDFPLNVYEGPRECTEGVTVRREDIVEAMARVTRGSGVVVVELAEDGDAIETVLQRVLPGARRVVFVIGDDRGLSELDSQALPGDRVRARIGSLQMLTSHCIVISHYLTDAIAGPSETAKPTHNPDKPGPPRVPRSECEICKVEK